MSRLLAEAASHGIEVRITYVGMSSPEAHIARVAQPKPVLHLAHGQIVGPSDLSATPQWAKPIVAAVWKMA